MWYTNQYSQSTEDTLIGYPREGYVLIRHVGGNIRNVQILGERILNKQLIGKDLAKHLIGRYVSVLYDGHPSQYQLIVK